MSNKRATKRALLTSILAICLCLVMLIGSTFAWFTDTASTGVNKIVAGNLDVELLMYQKGENGNFDYFNISKDPKPIFGAENSSVAQNNNLDTVWEPGKTQVAYLAIKNEGNLALKYKVALNVTNPADGKDLYQVMQYAIVKDAEATDSTPLSWTTGSNVTVGQQPVSEEASLTVGATHYFALLVHMDENAGNDYQNGKVDFDLTVYATQLNSEYDSFGKDYDQNAEYPDIWDGSINEDVAFTDGTATVSTAADFAGAAKKATANTDGNIQINLENSLVMNAAAWEPIVVDGNQGAGVLTINGNGNTISGLNAPLVLGGFAGNSGVIIKNLTIADSDISTSDTSIQGVGAFIANVDSMTTITLENCHLVNSTVSGKRVGGLIGWTSGFNSTSEGGPVPTTVKVENCSVVDSTVKATGSAGAIIGHAGANPATYHFIKNCKVENVTLNGTYKGLLIGTANVGEVTAENNILSGNVTNFVGRYALDTTGKVMINGTNYTNE